MEWRAWRIDGHVQSLGCAAMAVGEVSTGMWWQAGCTLGSARTCRAFSIMLRGRSSSAGKESACNAGESGSFPGLGRSTGEGISYHSSIVGLLWWFSWWGTRLQCWRPRFDPWVGKVPCRRDRLPTLVLWPGELTKNRTRLSNFHFHFILRSTGRAARGVFMGVWQVLLALVSISDK